MGSQQLPKITTAQQKNRHLEVHLVHHCNLNCAGCSHFSPSADTWFADVKQYKKDMDRLHEIGMLRKFRLIHLMGGEPLLHKDVNEFMEVTRKNYPKSEIKLSTNGILLPFNDKQEEKSQFWTSAKKNKVWIHLSWYPPLAKSNKKKIQEMAKKHGVKLFVKNKPEMRGPGFKLSGGYDRKDNFSRCPISICTNLLEGKLYTCAPLAYAFIFNKKYKQNLPETGGIDIYRDLTANQFMEELNTPVDLCGYCVITKDQFRKRLPWYQSGGKMEEYVQDAPESPEVPRNVSHETITVDLPKAGPTSWDKKK